MRKTIATIGILFLVSALFVASGCAAAPSPTPTQAPPTSAPKAPTAPTATTAPASAATKAPASPTPAAPAATPTSAALAPLNPRVPVKVGVLGSLVDIGIFAAYERGYFKDLGLDVELVNFNSAALMIPPLGTGQLDVGAGGISAGLFNAIQRDVPMKIVADKSHSEPGSEAQGYLVRKDLLESGAIKTPKDLKGRSIAFASRSTISENEADLLLAEGGLTMKDVEVKILGYPDQIIAFANKSIDFAYNFEPNVTTAKEKGVALMWRTSHSIIPYHESSVILYAPQFADKQPEAAKRFMLAYIKGVRDYNDGFFKNKGKDGVVSIITKYSTQKDPAIINKTVPQSINPDGYAYPESIQRDVDQFLKRGDMKEPIDLKKVIDNQYADYAIQILGKYPK